MAGILNITELPQQAFKTRAQYWNYSAAQCKLLSSDINKVFLKVLSTAFSLKNQSFVFLHVSEIILPQNSLSSSLIFWIPSGQIFFIFFLREEYFKKKEPN